MKKLSPKRMLKGKTVLLVLTGSIAAYKAGDLMQLLRNEGSKLICVLTESAKKFITPLTVRAISGGEVYDDFFSAETPYDVLHTSLADKADVILVAPASANFIARLAAGLADDLASCIILAAKKPVFIAPAMNDQMLAHTLTQRNITTLKDVGYFIIDPEVGHLVCGKEAVGHVAAPERIIASINTLLAR